MARFDKNAEQGSSGKLECRETDEASTAAQEPSARKQKDDGFDQADQWGPNDNLGG